MWDEHCVTRVLLSKGRFDYYKINCNNFGKEKKIILTTGPRGPRLIWDRSGVGPIGPIKPLGPGGPGDPNNPLSPGGPCGPGSPKTNKTNINELKRTQKKVRHRTHDDCCKIG